MSFEEKLIESVKEYEELYNLKHKNFRRIDIKEKIWENIAKDLNTTVELCKKRWKSLRDKFIKLSREMSQPSGSAADSNNEIKWKYYSYLTFLQGFNKAERTTGNYSEEIIVESESEQQTDCELSAVEEIPKKRRCGRKNDLENQFKEVLNTAAEAIQAEMSSTKSCTQKLFEALAQRVDEANLPNQRLNELHMAVTKLVYESI